jgi:bacterioferritin (cytochrome b1)
MQIETLKDVLHWTTKFHQHLSDCLEQCASKNESERARMLLDYLAKQEEKLTHIVDQFERTGDNNALNTWCSEYINKHPIVNHMHCDEPFATLNATQIMEVIVEQYEQVVELYRYLASRADIPSAKELMESLKSLEEHEIMRMVQTANRFQDM